MGRSSFRLRSPIATSFSGCVIGWATGYGLYSVYRGYTSEYGYGTDLDAVLWWSLRIACVWWALSIVILCSLSRLVWDKLNAAATVISGGALAIGTILIFSQTPQSSFWRSAILAVWWSLLVSLAAIGWIVGNRVTLTRAATPPSWSLVLANLAIGPALVIAWWMVVWPLFAPAWPDLSYRLGSEGTRAKVIMIVLNRVAVGERSSCLTSRLPAVFGNVPMTDGTWSGSVGGISYHVRVVESTIIELRLWSGRTTPS